MQPQHPDTKLSEFLVTAKQHTYASGGSSSTYAVAAVLPGSHQLEYASGDLLYRDVYFGESHFAGQEVVYHNATPIWSMCYAGGWTVALAAHEIDRLATLLQADLRAVRTDIPFRGPPDLARPPYRYENRLEGNLGRFEGVETMQKQGAVLYRLVYTGGRLD